ncbi:hypothetical protein OAM67_01075 [bacterium]|nr:hypothetical protein [bacterium]
MLSRSRAIVTRMWTVFHEIKPTVKAQDFVFLQSAQTTQFMHPIAEVTVKDLINAPDGHVNSFFRALETTVAWNSKKRQLQEMEKQHTDTTEALHNVLNMRATDIMQQMYRQSKRSANHEANELNAHLTDLQRTIADLETQMDEQKKDIVDNEMVMQGAMNMFERTWT